MAVSYTHLIGLLPQPFVTAAMAQNENLKMVLDLTEEWDKTQPENGSSLVTGVTVCRKEVLEQNPEAAELFVKEHGAVSYTHLQNAEKQGDTGPAAFVHSRSCRFISERRRKQ